MTAFYSAVSMACLWAFGHLVDRVGSRPLLGLATLTLVVHFSLWCSVGARLLPFNLTAIVLVQSTAAIGLSLFNLANTRLVMATVPPMGRSHFFALYTVVTSLISGFFPLSGASCSTRWRVGEDRGRDGNEPVQSVVRRGGLHYDDRGCHAKPSLRTAAMTTDAFLRELLVETQAAPLVASSRADRRCEPDLPREPIFDIVSGYMIALVDYGMATCAASRRRGAGRSRRAHRERRASVLRRTHSWCRGSAPLEIAWRI